MEKLETCLICGSNQHIEYLKCIDYLVTKEEFILNQCENCGFVFTNPRPAIEEIAPYYKSEDYYSHSDKNKSIISRIYNVIRNVNIKKKLNLINKVIKKQGNLLDYGCGAGLFIKYANGQGWVASGIEPNNDARDVTKKLGLKVDAPDFLETITEQKFDVITLWHVLEHLHDIEKVIPKLKSILNKNGILVVAVPNIDSWDAKKYKKNWAAYDVPRHLYHFTPKTIEKLFVKFGMSIDSIHPMQFDAYYVSMLSEGKPALAKVKAFINGLRSNMHAKSDMNYSSLIYFIK